MEFDFNRRLTKSRKEDFATLMKALSHTIGFKVSSRGWAYILEQMGHINKDQFDKVADSINDCRKQGFLPVDFVAEESARAFSGVEEPDEKRGVSMVRHLRWQVENVLRGGKYYTPDWWESEEYYIQMVVEKIDLVTLFKPVCEKFHIPIANAKGWSSISQRAEYCRRFKEAEDMGLKCVLLYCGDHDPDGLRISETLRSNLADLKDIVWDDGEEGYDPSDLIIDRFGLNYQFIMDNGFTWIDNLITGNTNKKLDLSNPSHVNHKLPYVQEYLSTVGARKCEANVIVTLPQVARALVTEAIENYVGPDALDRFQLKRDEVNQKYLDLLDQYEISEPIQKILDDTEDHEEE